MRWFMRRARPLALAFLPFFLWACATTALPPMGQGGKPFKLEDDEKRLWALAAKEQAKLDASDKILHDPLLEDYLREVGLKLLPPAVREQPNITFSFKVIKEPTLNAFAYPNGRIYVHTGMLARMENEAQLATVLGHEITHVTHRHHIRQVRDARNKQVAALVLAVAAAIGLAALGARQEERGRVVTGAVIRQTGNVLLHLGLRLGLMAAIHGYGRDLEREADEFGMANLVRAGYDPKEAPQVFRLLLKKYGDRTDIERFFFGRHPSNRERIANTEEFLRTRYAAMAKRPGLITNTKGFVRRTRPLVRENAWLDVQAGRYKLAKAQLQQVLAAVPTDYKAYYYMGEIYRRSGKSPEERMRAASHYERAVSLDPRFAEAHRALGILYFRVGEREKARRALREYVRLACERDRVREPAKDCGAIREYLIELSLPQ